MGTRPSMASLQSSPLLPLLPPLIHLSCSATSLPLLTSYLLSIVPLLLPLLSSSSLPLTSSSRSVVSLLDEPHSASFSLLLALLCLLCLLRLLLLLAELSLSSLLPQSGSWGGGAGGVSISIQRASPVLLRRARPVFPRLRWRCKDSKGTRRRGALRPCICS